MKEHEIRPEALLNRYLQLSASDAEACFTGVEKAEVPCVGCGGTSFVTEFEKAGFGYVTCRECGTLFQNPRPSIESFERFYRDAESCRYWAETFFPAVAEVRREKIFKPRAARLRQMCADRKITVDSLIDVGSGYGILLDEWRKAQPNTRLLAVEPSSSLAAECRRKGFAVVEDIVENVEGHEGDADLVICFEVLEHVYDPLGFLRAMRRLTRPGGYVFISTLGINGFDLQMLWNKSTQIAPPHHLNFLSVRGFEKLFERARLEDVVVSTPGELDVDIVRNAANRDPEILAGNRFFQNMFASSSQSAAFQQFLVANKLSSHVWVMGRRPQLETAET